MILVDRKRRGNFQISPALVYPEEGLLRDNGFFQPVYISVADGITKFFKFADANKGFSAFQNPVHCNIFTIFCNIRFTFCFIPCYGFA